MGENEYLLQEDGVSKFVLEDSSGFIILEEAIPTGIWIEQPAAVGIWIEQP